MPQDDTEDVREDALLSDGSRGAAPSTVPEGVTTRGPSSLMEKTRLKCILVLWWYHRSTMVPTMHRVSRAAHRLLNTHRQWQAHTKQVTNIPRK